jgi:hypothetical protein
MIGVESVLCASSLAEDSALGVLSSFALCRGECIMHFSEDSVFDTSSFAKENVFFAVTMEKAEMPSQKGAAVGG